MLEQVFDMSREARRPVAMFVDRSDGTTTATLLAQSIVNEGMKFVAAGFDP